jgi:mRNA interferase RelE/StbE
MSLEIRINKTFLKELSRLPVNQRKIIEHFVFNEARNFKRPDDIPNLKKLKRFKFYYRIRFGNYRAGLRIQNNILVFERLLHRKDIYKFYP